jgi:hypothetical protein
MPRQPDPGPIVLPSDIELATKAILEDWIPFYLADIDEQQGRDRGTTRTPRLYDIASDTDQRWLEEVPPAVLIACPGTTNDPERHNDTASYGAWWQINIAVTAAGATELGSRDLAGRLGGAIVYTLTQQSDLGGLAADARWRGLRLDVIDRGRGIAACEVLGEVYVAQVVQTRGMLPRDLPVVPTNPADELGDVTGARIRVTGRP